MRLVSLLLLVLVPSCVTARLHVGPTVDFAGHVGVEGGLTLGAGSYGHGRAPVMFVESVGGGFAPGTTHGALSIAAGVDYVREPDGDSHGVAFRAGPRLGAQLRHDLADLSTFGFVAAWLPYSHGSSSGCCDSDDKFAIFEHDTTDWTNFGLELGVFGQIPRGSGVRDDAGGYAQASVTWEWTTLTRMR